MKITKSNNSVKILSTIVICVMVLCASLLIFQFFKISSLKNKTKKLEAASSALQERINEYDQQLNYIGDPDNPNSNYNNYLQDYAREVLNWGKSDRVYFVSE